MHCVFYYNGKNLFAHMGEVELTLDRKDFATNNQIFIILGDIQDFGRYTVLDISLKTMNSRNKAWRECIFHCKEELKYRNNKKIHSKK